MANITYYTMFTLNNKLLNKKTDIDYRFKLKMMMFI